MLSIKKSEFLISYHKLRTGILFYTMIPISLFFLGWLKIYISIPLILLLCVCIKFVNKDKIDMENYIIFSKKGVVIILCIALAWCFFSGIGGYWAQSTDFSNRNAIFRDLIQSKWPVYYYNSAYYNNGHPFSLVYYIAFWIVPACFGKLTLILTGNLSVAWSIGNLALYLWAVLGLTLIFLLLISYVMKDSVKRITLKGVAWVCLLFIMFSGLDGISLNYS